MTGTASERVGGDYFFDWCRIWWRPVSPAAVRVRISRAGELVTILPMFVDRQCLDRSLSAWPPII